MKTLRVVIVVIGALLLARAGEATTVIIGPTSATTTMGETWPLTHAFDQSGLSAGYVSGVTDFDAYIAGNPTHTSAPGTDWVSTQVAGQADFDLGGPHIIDRAAVWNFGANLLFAIQSARIVTALDAAFTSGVVDHGLYNLNIFSNPNPAQILLTGPTQARYVRLTDFVGNGATGIALGEIAFRQIPEPTTLTLTTLGLLAMCGRRRKR